MADQRASSTRIPCPNSSFSCSFRGKLAKILGWRPTCGVSTPRLVNPGSVTDTHWFLQLFTHCNILQSSSTRATESAIGDDNSKDDEEENEDEDDEKLVKSHNYDPERLKAFNVSELIDTGSNGVTRIILECGFVLLTQWRI